jgi:hypothetical protein
MARSATIYTERILHRIIRDSSKMAVCNLNDCHYSTVIELILYVRMYRIVDIVSDLELALK